MRGSFPTILLVLLPMDALLSAEGIFLAPLTLTNVIRPEIVATGDFNKDGKLDLVVANGTGNIQFLLQDPLRRDQWSRASLTAGSGSFFVRTADFDQDGF